MQQVLCEKHEVKGANRKETIATLLAAEGIAADRRKSIGFLPAAEELPREELTASVIAADSILAGLMLKASAACQNGVLNISLW